MKQFIDTPIVQKRDQIRSRKISIYSVLVFIFALVLSRRRQGRLFILILLVTTSEVYSQTEEGRLPVIDFHVHANSVSIIGPSGNPPLDLPYNDPEDD